MSQGNPLAVDSAAQALADLVNAKVARESDGEVDTHLLLAATERELERLWDLRRSEMTDSYVPRRPLPGITEKGTRPVKSEREEEVEEAEPAEVDEDRQFLRELFVEQPRQPRRRAARVSRGPTQRLKAA